MSFGRTDITIISSIETFKPRAQYSLSFAQDLCSSLGFYVFYYLHVCILKCNLIKTFVT